LSEINAILRKSGQELEESLVLSPKEQQEWFSLRHQFDLVVIYDEDSRINSYAGGPIFDIHQTRLRNLTVAIFDYAGYRKPLKHVPMLLVGGLRAWCQLVRENPLRPVAKIEDSIIKLAKAPELGRREKPRHLTDVADVEPDIDKLDLEAESQWLESLQSERFIPIVFVFNIQEMVFQLEAPALVMWIRES
jgi:ubiquitin carboxyl-terminal hydrolase 8